MSRARYPIEPASSRRRGIWHGFRFVNNGMERLATALREARATLAAVSEDTPYRCLIEPVLAAIDSTQSALDDSIDGKAKREPPSLTDTLTRRVAELEQTVRAYDEFLSTLGHELRNPLSPLFMQAQYLLDIARKSDDGVITTQWIVPRLQAFCRRLQRFLTTIERIMDVSRAGAGRLSLELEHVNLSELLQESCASLDRESSLARSPLELDIEPDVTGWWDRMRLEQICNNLLSNALRYGAGKPIQVSLRAADGKIRLEVQDSGIGIAEQDQQRIFQRFQRAVRQGHSGGLGIGLWIVRESCRAMGGDVEVRSQLGRGATFAVTLPTHMGASGG